MSAGRRSAVADGSPRNSRRSVPRHTPDQLAEKLVIEAQDKIAQAQELRTSPDVALSLKRSSMTLCNEVELIAELISQTKPRT